MRTSSVTLVSEDKSSATSPSAKRGFLHKLVAGVFAAALATLAPVAVGVLTAPPASAAYPVGGPYAPNPNGNGDTSRMDAWVNWEGTCGAPTGLRCFTYMKIVSPGNDHVAGRWVDGGGWQVVYAPKPQAGPRLPFPLHGANGCRDYRLVVEHYTQLWASSGTWTFEGSAGFKGIVSVGAGYTTGAQPNVKVAKQEFTSPWARICPALA